MSFRIVVLCMLLPLLASGQYFDNRLNLAVSGVVEFPIGIVEQDGISTLFSNYETGFGFSGYFEYKVTKKLYLGASFTSMNFSGSKVSDYPLTIEPSSAFNMYFVRAKYLLPGQKTRKGLLLNAILEIGMVDHKLSMKDLNIISMVPIDVSSLSYKESDFGALFGVNAEYTINNIIAAYSQLTYRFVHAENVLYSDKSFQSFGLSLGFYFRLWQSNTTVYEYD